jgi:hypothetical protein
MSAFRDGNSRTADIADGDDRFTPHAPGGEVMQGVGGALQGVRRTDAR